DGRDPGLIDQRLARIRSGSAGAVDVPAELLLNGQRRQAGLVQRSQEARLAVAVGLREGAEVGIVERDLDAAARMLVAEAEGSDVRARQQRDRENRDEDSPVRGHEAGLRGLRAASA